eukprot:Pgem_evm1s7481
MTAIAQSSVEGTEDKLICITKGGVIDDEYHCPSAQPHLVIPEKSGSARCYTKLCPQGRQHVSLYPKFFSDTNKMYWFTGCIREEVVKDVLKQ